MAGKHRYQATDRVSRTVAPPTVNIVPNLRESKAGLKAAAFAMSIVVAAGLVVLANTANADTPFSIRIAAGATDRYKDPSGNVWSADRGAVGGTVYRSNESIAGTTADVVYRRHRWGASGYTLPVDCAGSYKVTMHWAETTRLAKGKRVFGVTAEGARVIDRVDVAGTVGRNRAMTKSFSVKVTDGRLDLGLRRIVEDPMISGLEVARTTACAGSPPAATSPATPTATSPAPTVTSPAPTMTSPVPAPGFDTRLNVASATGYTDPDGDVWAPDKGFAGGSSWYGGTTSVANTSADPLYRKHRWGMSGYQVAVPANGTYRVDLHLAELVFAAAGRRVFDVKAEGTTRVDDIDVFAAVGADAALVKSFNVAVSDGTLNLGFAAVKDDPMVSAIEVTRVPAGGSTPTTAAPTTAAPTSVAPTTAAPTTAAPTSAAPTTAAPTTPAPPTTGWPDASNTGVPAGTTLRPSGSITVTTPGAVIEGLDVSGSIFVRADNVTIRKTRVRGGRIDAGYGSEQKGLVIEDVEIDGLRQDAFTSAIGDANFTCLRCHIHGVGQGVHMYQNVVVVDSYIHDIYYQAPSHNEPIISNGGSNFTIRHNNLEMADLPGGSAALALYGDFAPIQNVLVENNLFNGGGFCVYAGSVAHKAYPVATNVRFLNNAFGRKIHGKCGYHGAVDAWNGAGAGNQWSGNYWADTRAAL